MRPIWHTPTTQITEGSLTFAKILTPKGDDTLTLGTTLMPAAEGIRRVRNKILKMY